MLQSSDNWFLLGKLGFGEWKFHTLFHWSSFWTCRCWLCLILIFLEILCPENKKTRGRSQTPTSSMIKFLVTIYRQEVITYWENSSNLDDVGTVNMPLYAIIFSCHDKTGSIEEERPRRPREPRGNILHNATFFLFAVLGILFIASCVEKSFFLDRSICILLTFLQHFVWINIMFLDIFE